MRSLDRFTHPEIPVETRFLYSAFDYPTAPAAADAVEAKRDAMTVADGELRSSGAVERT